MRAAIEVSIDELVLHGFAPGDRHRIRAAVERELGRLFLEHGAPPALAQPRDIRMLDGGTVEVVPGAPGGAVGYEVARALYGGLSR
jgi:hypothetical protein